jgi:SulP family sulfate permease
VVLSAFLFINRLSKTVNVKTITKDFAEDEETLDYNAISTRDVPHGVEVFEVHGPLFFGMISSFTNAIHNLAKDPKVRIIRMRYVFSIDETAINALRQANSFCRKHQIVFILSGVHTQPLIALQRSGFLDEIGQDRIFGNIDDALNSARTILGLPTIPRPQPFIPSVEREKNLASMEQAKEQAKEQ